MRTLIGAWLVLTALSPVAAGAQDWRDRVDVGVQPAREDRVDMDRANDAPRPERAAPAERREPRDERGFTARNDPREDRRDRNNGGEAPSDASERLDRGIDARGERVDRGRDVEARIDASARLDRGSNTRGDRGAEVRARIDASRNADARGDRSRFRDTPERRGDGARFADDRRATPPRANRFDPRRDGRNDARDARRDSDWTRSVFDNDDGWSRRSSFADADRTYNSGTRWNGNWRGDRRYDWNGYRGDNRAAFRLPRYYAPAGWGGYRRFGIGAGLGASLWGRNYWIADPYAYRLPEAYGPYRWVRYYDDALLVDLRSGIVVDAVYGIFW